MIDLLEHEEEYLVIRSQYPCAFRHYEACTVFWNRAARVYFHVELDQVLATSRLECYFRLTFACRAVELANQTTGADPRAATPKQARWDYL
jgi:hypothetical protein